MRPSSPARKQSRWPVPTLEDCVQKYLASHKHELREKTYGQYSLYLARLQRYCERHGVNHMCELNVDLLETFKVEGLPDLADTSKSTSRQVVSVQHPVSRNRVRMAPDGSDMPTYTLMWFGPRLAESNGMECIRVIRAPRRLLSVPMLLLRKTSN